MEDRTKKLDQARRLLESGVITPQEFNAERDRLSGKLEESPPRDSPVSKAGAPKWVSKKPRRSVHTTRYMIVLALFSLVIGAGLLLWASSKSSAVSRSTSIDEPDGPSHPPFSSAAADPVPTSEVLKVEVLPRLCKNRELKVILPDVETGGSIVVNYPLDDTEGMGEVRMGAEPFICIGPEDLSQFSGSEKDALVGYTQGPRYTSPLEYSVLMCDELSEVPHPPKTLRIGHFRWHADNPVREVKVEWYSDYRSHIENTCHE